MRTWKAVCILLALPAMASADDLAVTVYNNNLGVVSESRRLDFDKGIGRLAFRDVPAQIDAASVRFELIGSDHNVAILEQNYAFDLVSPDQMYSKYTDKEIELIDKDGHLYAGTLLAYRSGAVTIKESTGQIKIILLDNIAEVNFPSLPDGLITRPTLFWEYQSDFAGPLDCRVGYQTSGLSWNAEYVGLLNPDESQLDLSGWASINNTSGKTYDDATLKLIAGDIGRATQSPRMLAKGMAMAATDQAAGFEEKAFFEYHMYTLPRKATLADKEIKQISLFDPARTSVDKIYTYRPESDPTKVEVDLKFVNSKAAGLGMPLPAGRVRLFKADDDGSVILLGEDRIKHTPRDEEVTVTVGNAFDVVAEERLMNQTRVSPKVEDRNYEIELRNRKDSDITVRVEKKLYGYWEILESSLPYKTKDANTIEFNVPVKAGETVKLTYAVRFTSN